MKFSEFIRQRGFTIVSLAEASSVSARTLEQYSSGRYPLKNARAWVIVAIARTLETTPEYLLALDTENE